MDSSNSGSIPSSSSGGDDDYDSRTEAISSFLNLPPPPPPPPPPPSSHHLHQHPSPSSFISLSPYLNAFPSTPPDPYPLSLDMTWAKSLPSSSLSDPGCTILGGLTTTTTSSSSTSSSSKTMVVGAPSHSPHSGNTSLNPLSVQLPSQPTQPVAASPRVSKKRSRASRRAPTTVLTTDTSNFRAMVQEFTGFPAAPFNMSSPFSRPRLDLFPATAAAPPYLLRPFAQKGQAPFFSPFSSPSSCSSSSSSVAAFIARSSVANANAACSNSSSSSTTTSSSNYQLPSIGLRHPNLLNMQSPNFTFQSPALQPLTSPDHNSSTMPAFGGSSDYTAGGLGSLIAMEGTKLSSSSRDDGFPGWAGGSASEGRDRSQLRSVIGNYGTLQLVSSHAGKESAESMTAAARGEGRVDSWILSSD